MKRAKKKVENMNNPNHDRKVQEIPEPSAFSGVLPGIEPNFVFTFYGKQLFVTYEGEKRQVKAANIIANGLHDLCFCLDDNGNVTVMRIAKVDKSKILHVPAHDILWLVLKEPLQNKRSIILEIDESLKPVADEIVRTFHGEPRKDYYMYGGDDYGNS
jgi:hypothetical protein